MELCEGAASGRGGAQIWGLAMISEETFRSFVSCLVNSRIVRGLPATSCDLLRRTSKAASHTALQDACKAFVPALPVTLLLNRQHKCEKPPESCSIRVPEGSTTRSSRNGRT